MFGFIPWIGGLFSSVFGWIAGLGITAVLLGWLSAVSPIVAAIVNAIGTVLSAIFEIVAALAKSPEGRVVLVLIIGIIGWLYLRFHYFEEGKASVMAQLQHEQAVCKAQLQAAQASGTRFSRRQRS
jgi:hypothetical protein